MDESFAGSALTSLVFSEVLGFVFAEYFHGEWVGKAFVRKPLDDEYPTGEVHPLDPLRTAIRVRREFGLGLGGRGWVGRRDQVGWLGWGRRVFEPKEIPPVPKEGFFQDPVRPGATELAHRGSEQQF